MKLNLNPKDYRRLLIALYLGDWLLNSYRVEPASGLGRKCREAITSFLGYAVPGGCADLVDEVTPGAYDFADAVHEEPGVAEAIDDYEDESFWRNLVERLAERDFEQLHGRPPHLRSEDEDDSEAAGSSADEIELERLEARYWREFEKDGIQNLHVLKFGQPS
jgi:hypothetical protein